MRNSFKLVLILALMVAMVFAFAACGEGGSSDNGGASGDVKGDVIDAGNVSAICPSGWMNVPVNDLWSDDPEATDPDALRFYKGAKSDMDLFSTPSVGITYYDENTTLLDVKDWYDNVVDLDPIEINGVTWTGFTGEFLEGYPSATLTSDDGRCQVTVDLHDYDGKVLTLDDAEVLAILGSITY